MNLFDVVILSVIEGITEFLPVSSTGHLILASKILDIPQTDFVKSFEIFIQLGAILAVIFLFGKKFLVNRNIIYSVGAAFIPSSIIGLIFYKFIKANLLGNFSVTVISLIAGGIILIFIEIILGKRKKSINSVDRIEPWNALKIGAFQAISVIPGVSRSGATIVGGMLLNLDRKTAAEFSFLLAVPTIFAATVLDILKSDFYFRGNDIFILTTGFILSFLSAILGIKLLIQMTSKFSLVYFGIYRIILGIAFIYYS